MKVSISSFILALYTAASFGGETCVSPDPAEIKIGGYLGSRLDACLEKNVKGTDPAYITDIFKREAKLGEWQTEFWGKWMHSAVPFWRYSNDAALKAKIDASVQNVLSAQRPNGYIGNYKEPDQTAPGGWDVWGRKYTLLGFLHYYDATHDQAALAAARRVADHLMTQFGPGRADIYRTGCYRGLPSCSVLEPIVWLYNRTGDKRYLDFASYIVSQLAEPAEGTRMIAQAAAGVDVADRKALPDDKSLNTWWGYPHAMTKAYEMMSCYQGMVEYYEDTGDKRCLDAAIASAKNIIATEINAAGSGASGEHWYHGKARQTFPAESMMETCVTITWMRLCEKLLRLTHDPVYADQFELSLYNAFLASLTSDGAVFAKYTPLTGFRSAGGGQCGMTTHCCNANGARGFVQLLETLAMAEPSALYVNLYAPADATLTRGPGGPKVSLKEETDYPASGLVKITLSPAEPAEFTVNFRIPAWSAQTAATLNGQPVAGVKPGSYLAIKRAWKAGDTVTLSFDMSPRCETLHHRLSIRRGPVTLARDARFNDGCVNGIVEPDKNLTLTPAQPFPGGWLAFTAKMRIGVNRELPEWNVYRDIHLCDFASAGNDWKETSLYNIWLPVPLNPNDNAD